MGQLIPVQFGHVLEYRKTVAVLPDQVGQHQQQRQTGGDPRVAFQQQFSVRGKQQSHQQSRQKKHDHVFIQEKQTESQPQAQQVAAFFRIQIAQGEIKQHRPTQDIEHDGHK